MYLYGEKLFFLDELPVSGIRWCKNPRTSLSVGCVNFDLSSFLLFPPLSLSVGRVCFVLKGGKERYAVCSGKPTEGGRFFGFVKRPTFKFQPGLVSI